jgi:RimJ/RimL family protein N-acetyltransferase
MTVIHTDRLEITELSVYNVAFVIALLNSPGWLQYIGDRGVHTAEEAINWLQQGPMKSYEEHGYGLWLVKLLASNEPIGICGLIHRDYLPHADIGLAYLPQYGGQGYAGEAANAVLQFAADKGMTAVQAITMPDNEPSLRLLKKLGFEESGLISPPGELDPLVLLTKEL